MFNFLNYLWSFFGTQRVHHDPDTFDPVPIKSTLDRTADRRNAAKAGGQEEALLRRMTVASNSPAVPIGWLQYPRPAEQRR
jgi:hypothetical protein